MIFGPLSFETPMRVFMLNYFMIPRILIFTLLYLLNILLTKTARKFLIINDMKI